MSVDDDEAEWVTTPPRRRYFSVIVSIYMSTYTSSKAALWSQKHQCPLELLLCKLPPLLLVTLQLLKHEYIKQPKAFCILHGLSHY